MIIEIETEDLIKCAKEKVFSQVEVKIKCAKHMGLELSKHIEQVYYR